MCFKNLVDKLTLIKKFRRCLSWTSSSVYQVFDRVKCMRLCKERGLPCCKEYSVLRALTSLVCGGERKLVRVGVVVLGVAYVACLAVHQCFSCFQ